MATYNHAFSLAFALEKSNYEDPMDALKREKQQIVNALLERVQEIIQNYEESAESMALEPYDTHEE